MSRIPRPTALLAVAAVAVPILTACGSAKSTTQAGTAASVGSDRITTTELAARVDRALKDPTAKTQNPDKAVFERRILTLMIDHQLVADAAKKQNVTVTDGEVNARYATYAKQAGGEAALIKQGTAAGIPGPDLKPYLRDLLLTEKIGDKLLASQPVSQDKLVAAYRAGFYGVHSAHILVKTKKSADSILAQVKADPSKFAALAKKYSTDTGSKTKAGDLGTQPPSKFVAPFAAALASTKVGGYVVAKSQFGYHVIHVISRKATKSLAAATPEIKAQLQASSRQAAVGALLKKESETLGIKVNPRFGTWDAAKGDVEPAKQLSSPGAGSGSPTPGASPTG